MGTPRKMPGSKVVILILESGGRFRGIITDYTLNNPWWLHTSDHVPIASKAEHLKSRSIQKPGGEKRAAIHYVLRTY